MLDFYLSANEELLSFFSSCRSGDVRAFGILIENGRAGAFDFHIH